MHEVHAVGLREVEVRVNSCTRQGRGANMIGSLNKNGLNGIFREKARAKEVQETTESNTIPNA